MLAQTARFGKWIAKKRGELRRSHDLVNTSILTVGGMLIPPTPHAPPPPNRAHPLAQPQSGLRSAVIRTVSLGQRRHSQLLLGPETTSTRGVWLAGGEHRWWGFAIDNHDIFRPFASISPGVHDAIRSYPGEIPGTVQGILHLRSRQVIYTARILVTFDGKRKDDCTGSAMSRRRASILVYGKGRPIEGPDRLSKRAFLVTF